MGKHIRCVEDIHNIDDAIKWARECARKKGVNVVIEEGTNHTIVKVPGVGMNVLPRHGHRDFATGTRHSIIKTYILIGLGVLVVVAVLAACS